MLGKVEGWTDRGISIKDLVLGREDVLGVSGFGE